MASVHRDPRSPHGVWYCALATADGRRVWRTTKKHNKRQAQVLCDAWQQAEHTAPGNQLPEFMEREIRDNDYVIMYT